MTAGQAIDAYLRDVAAGLPGRRRQCDDVVAELRAGLLDALDGHVRAGLAEDEAVARATAEFGDPGELAASFRPELAARTARRFALTLAVTGPVIGLLWTAAAVASHITIHRVLSWNGALILAGLVVTIGGVVVTLAATGSLAGRLASRPRIAPAVAAASGYGTMTVDMAVFAVVAGALTSNAGGIAPVPVAVAAAASLVRLLLTGRSARQCVAARATLTPNRGWAR